MPRAADEVGELAEELDENMAEGEAETATGLGKDTLPQAGVLHEMSAQRLQ